MSSLEVVDYAHRRAERSSSMSCLMVTVGRADANGVGGNHRTYQVVHDLRDTFGSDAVEVVHWWELGRIGSQTQRNLPWSDRARRRIKRTAKACTAWSVNSKYSQLIGTIQNDAFADGYRILLRAKLAQGPVICVIDHPALVQVMDINRQEGVPTALCAQNFESLVPWTSGPLTGSLRAAMLDFAFELDALRKCDARLCISLTERSFLVALGIESLYYPYRPVGRIRRDLEAIRKARADSGCDARTLLLIGTMSYGPTQHAARSLLVELLSTGALEGWRVVTAGLGSKELHAEIGGPPQIQALGWVEPDELKSLMIRCTAALVPLSTGFGALTRISEFCCAGIPVMASDIALHAFEAPPGVTSIGRTGLSWNDAIRQSHFSSTPSAAYDEWWSRQMPPSVAVANLCHGLSDHQ